MRGGEGLESFAVGDVLTCFDACFLKWLTALQQKLPVSRKNLKLVSGEPKPFKRILADLQASGC